MFCLVDKRRKVLYSWENKLASHLFWRGHQQLFDFSAKDWKQGMNDKNQPKEVDLYK